jgi:hypothetical protein
MDILTTIAATLLSFYQFDLMVFSQWWLYVFILPVILYLPFFLIKWVVLTAPLWLPVHLMFNGLVKIKNVTKAKKKDE